MSNEIDEIKAQKTIGICEWCGKPSLLTSMFYGAQCLSCHMKSEQERIDRQNELKNYENGKG